MSSRPQLSPQPVIEDGDLSDDLTSLVTIIQKISMVSYSYSWSGSSPVAAVTVEVSNDYEQNADGSVKVAGNWDELPLSTTPSISGNTGSGVIDINQISAYAIRTKITNVSGTGVVNVSINGKVA